MVCCLWEISLFLSLSLTLSQNLMKAKISRINYIKKFRPFRQLTKYVNSIQRQVSNQETTGVRDMREILLISLSQCDWKPRFPAWTGQNQNRCSELVRGCDNMFVIPPFFFPLSFTFELQEMYHREGLRALTVNQRTV